MTLIELLVVIVILTTLVAGVIPLLSPNNDTRKIREASRELQTFLMQAQAQAARTGRPAGVGFRETEVDAGSAQEVYFVEEPQAYSGLSEYSRVRLHFNPGTEKNPGGKVDGVQFLFADLPVGPLFAAQLNGPRDYAPEPIPPNLIRYGDLLDVEGELYVINDPDRDGDGRDDATTGNDRFRRGDFYTNERNVNRSSFKLNPWQDVKPDTPVVNRRLERNIPDPDTPGAFYSNPLLYRIRRQPAQGAGTPLQFPSGIGIDMDASGIEADLFPPQDNLAADQTPPLWGFRSMMSKADSGVGVSSSPTPTPFQGPIGVQVLFAPEGHVSGIYVNREQLPNTYCYPPSRLFLLLGRVENAPVATTDDKSGQRDTYIDDVDFSGVATGPDGDDQVLQRRERVNWLNADSRWIAIDVRQGRFVTAENALSDPREFAGQSSSVPEQIARQVRAARQFAGQMQQEGGR